MKLLGQNFFCNLIGNITHISLHFMNGKIKILYPPLNCMKHIVNPELGLWHA